MRASSTMNTTDRFVRFAAEGEVMAKFSRSLAQLWRAISNLAATAQQSQGCAKLSRLRLNLPDFAPQRFLLVARFNQGMLARAMQNSDWGIRCLACS